MSQWTANCDKPIKMCQPLTWAVTIFAATDLIRGIVFRFFCFFLYHAYVLQYISDRNLRFVDCQRLLSDRPGDFTRSSRSYIWTQAQIESECSVAELPANLIANFWQGSFSERSFPPLWGVFLRVLVKQTGWWITRLVFVLKMSKYPHPTRLAE